MNDHLTRKPNSIFEENLQKTLWLLFKLKIKRQQEIEKIQYDIDRIIKDMDIERDKK